MTTLADLPESTIRRIIDYVDACAYLTNGRHDWRIPHLVANDWALRGGASLSTKDLARRFKTTRRTICKAIDRLIDARAIREIGRTADNRPIYAPCLERGDEWRARNEGHQNGQC